MVHNRLLQKTFENRGYSDSFLQEIEVYDHDTLEHIDALCAKLHEIHEHQRKIVILPDFDMDGIAAGTLGFAGLSELGFCVSLYIPNPADGYGFDEHTIDDLLTQHPDASVILTCDVGVGEIRGITYAKALGFEVLVTDHHIQQYQNPADVLVDPMSVTDTYSHPMICGAYVLYQCLQHYADTYCNTFVQEQIQRLRVFAGIGTVSDAMPLLYENRQLVRDMISISHLIWCDGDDTIVNMISGCDVYRRAFYGLHCMFQAFSDIDVIGSRDDISETFFGYYFAPAFNSVKRMSGHLSEAFLVFFGANQKSHAEYLIELNNKRKAAVTKYWNQMITDPQPYAPFVYLSDAPTGLLGLLAQKMMLCDPTHPVVVVRKDENYHGSGRSPAWYPFIDRTKDSAFYVAGHQSAFGIGLENISEIWNLMTFLQYDVAQLRPAPADLEPVYDFVIAQDGTGDTQIDILLFMEYLSELRKYQPFGKGFPQPNILLKFSNAESTWQYSGRAKQHLKIVLPYGFTVLLWNQASEMARHDKCTEHTIAGYLELSEFNGVHTMNFIGEFV